jgi:DNA-binding IclR family transcriptional regulator
VSSLSRTQDENKSAGSTLGDGSNGSATLNRALEILDALAEVGGEGIAAGRLATRTGINRVTVHRILNTFKAHGFVRQDAPGAGYQLGFRFLEIAERIFEGLDIVRLSQPALQRLAQETGETVHLAILDGPEAVYVAKAESTQAVRLVSRVGLRVPLYCTSLGKALLAARPGGAGDLITQQSFTPRTPSTIRTREQLEVDLAAIRARGFAIDHAENEPGVHCVGAAITDHRGEPIGALSVSGPDSRVTEARLGEFGALVSKYARELSAALGGATEPGAA